MNGDREAPTVDYSGAVMGAYMVDTSTCEKRELLGTSGGLLALSAY